jgi:hypothetical protein
MIAAAGNGWYASSGMGTVEDIAALTARERARVAMASRGRSAMTAEADKLGALVDVVRALDGMHASYAIVGGVAVGIRSGVPRATLDTDLAVTSTVPRASVVRALVDAGFEMRGEFAHSVNFRHASGEPVQIMFDPTFDPMIARAEPVVMGDSTVRVVLTADLISMKELAAADPGRRRSKALRDRADIELLRGDVPDPDEGW